MATFFTAFTRGLCRRLILLAIWLIIVLIAWGRLGSGVGLEDLFWHEVWWHQVLVGLTVTLLLGQLALVAYLLEADNPWLAAIHPPKEDSPWQPTWRFVDAILTWLVPSPPPSRTPSPTPSPPGDADMVHWQTLRWFLLCTWVPLVLLVLIPAFVYLNDVNDFDRHPVVLYGNERWCVVLGVVERWPLLVGTFLAGVVTHLFVLLFGIRVAARAALPSSRWPWFRDLFLDQRWLHSLALANFAILFITFWLLFALSWFPGVAAWISPFFALCVVLGLFAGTYGFVTFHLRGYRFLVLLGLAALGLVANVNGIFFDFKQRFPALDYSYRRHLEPPQRTGLTEEQLRKERELRLQDQYDQLCKNLPADELKAWERRLADLEKRNFFARGIERDDRLTVQLSGLLEWLELRKLNRWKEHVQALRPNVLPKLVVVATSGGANRAALWTMVVLTSLEGQSDLEAIHSHVRLITGASGGMFGAAYYVATMTEDGQHANRGRTGASPGTPLSRDELVERIGQDALTTVAQRMLFSDVPHLLLPWSYERDRGLALEEAWDQHLEGALAIPMRQLAAGEKLGWRPTLVFSPMLIEDGRRLIISNAGMPFLTETGGSVLDKVRPKPAPGTGGRQPARPRVRPPSNRSQSMARQLADPSHTGETVDDTPPLRYSLAGFEFFRLFPDADQFRLSTAVRMNASFPYVSPAVDLPTYPARRVVDAGYYDNYGVNVAACWLHHYRDWIKKNTGGVLLIQVRDELSERRRVESDVARDVEAWRWSRSIEWLTGPALGVFAAMESVMSFRNDEQVQMLHETFNPPPPDASVFGPPPLNDFFTTIIFECPKHVAYNWYLSQATKNTIKSGFQTEVNAQALARLKEWWAGK